MLALLMLWCLIRSWCIADASRGGGAAGIKQGMWQLPALPGPAVSLAASWQSAALQPCHSQHPRRGC